MNRNTLASLCPIDRNSRWWWFRCSTKVPYVPNLVNPVALDRSLKENCWAKHVVMPPRPAKKRIPSAHDKFSVSRIKSIYCELQISLVTAPSTAIVKRRAYCISDDLIDGTRFRNEQNICQDPNFPLSALTQFPVPSRPSGVAVLLKKWNGLPNFRSFDQTCYEEIYTQVKNNSREFLYILVQ